MNEIVIAGMLAGYGIALPVGAPTLLILMLSAQSSLRTGLAAGMGTATADGLYALVAALAGAAVAGLVAPIAVPMRWTAGVVLVLIAVRGIIGAVRRSRGSDVATQTEAKGPLRAYLELLGITILNPLTIVYFSALVLGLRNDTWPSYGSVVFVLAAFIASASWQAVLAIGGALVGRLLTSDKGRLGTALVGNGVIIALATHLVLS
jgi:arginine exporter protein ArgO